MTFDHRPNKIDSKPSRPQPEASDTKSLTASQQRSQELFQALVLSSPIGIFIVEDGRFVSVNPRFEALTGFSESELVGQNSLSMVLPEDREMVRKKAIRMLKGEDSTPYEYRVLKSNGEILWIMETVTSIQLEGKRGALGNFMDIGERQRAEEALRNSEKRYRDLFENANDIIYIHDLKGKLISINKTAEIVSGYDRSEVLYLNYKDLIAPEYLTVAENMVRQQLTWGTAPNFELMVKTKDGRPVPLEVRTRLIRQNGKIEAVQGIARDITERKMMENQLRITNQRLLDIIEFLPDATFVIDQDKKVIAWNRAIEKMTGVSKEQIIGQGNHAYAVPFYGWPRLMLVDLIGVKAPELKQQFGWVTQEGNNLYAEVFVPSVYGGLGAYLWVKASPLFDSEGNLVGAIESARDITERKQAEEQLRYLSLHDSLTSLYNRAYFEEEMNRMDSNRFNPVGIIVFDVDGLKLVNDTLGHEAGDKLLKTAACLISESLRESDMVARVGGDEFAVLLPQTPVEAVDEICNRIRLAIFNYNAVNPELPLSISMGRSIKTKTRPLMAELYKEADNNMYREKLHRSQSARSAIVQTLIKAIAARDFLTEGHSHRMKELVTMLGQIIGLPEPVISDLCLLAEFHDIGKVGIPDRILLKPGRLTPEEYAEMKRHCEIGHRIALSSPDLMPLADWILKHHEWWDGKGYPLGLKGEEIPLECRILAIADAYDAMTSARPYRTALPHKKAIAELLECSGTQFDPNLVRLFVNQMNSRQGPSLEEKNAAEPRFPLT